jgi:large subunit ribosomal protein L29
VKPSKLREQSDEEIRQLLDDANKEILDLRMNKGKGDSSVQPLRIRTLRREIARIQTIMREREIKKNG